MIRRLLARSQPRLTMLTAVKPMAVPLTEMAGTVIMIRPI
jgi:hypothetical protein